MKPRILWASPFSLHDTTSGAAMEVKCLLENLVERGMNVLCMSCFIFDNPNGRSLFTRFEEEMTANPEQHFFDVNHNDIRYIYMRTKSWAVADICDAEQRRFFSRYCGILNEFKPDMLIMYGGGMLEMGLRSEAKRRGIPVVYSLCNPNHRQYSFPDVDMVITASEATAKLYAESSSINALPTGPFIRPERVVAPERKPKYITFVNPVAEKGTGLMARLALMARKQLPDERFLVVRSRGDWTSLLPKLKTGGEPLNSADFTNVDVAEHTSDMRQVYALTKVVLMPSLWFEAFGMVATEACMNGIPVLATRRGGLPEAIAGSGKIFDAPAACLEDPLQMPTEEDMQPWMDALKEILAGPESLNEWGEKARTAVEVHALSKSVDRAISYFEPLLARRAGSNPQLFRSGSLVGC